MFVCHSLWLMSVCHCLNLSDSWIHSPATLHFLFKSTMPPSPVDKPKCRIAEILQYTCEQRGSYRCFPIPRIFMLWAKQSQLNCFKLISSQMPRETVYWNHKTSRHRYDHRRGQSTCKPQVRPWICWNVVGAPCLMGINHRVKSRFCSRTPMEGDCLLRKFLRFDKLPKRFANLSLLCTNFTVGNPDSRLQIRFSPFTWPKKPG